MTLADELERLVGVEQHARWIVRNRQAVIAALREREAWNAKCDEVGVPHDPDMLVRHHRANAGLAATLDARSEYTARLDALRARAEADADFWRSMAVQAADDGRTTGHLREGWIDLVRAHAAEDARLAASPPEATHWTLKGSGAHGDTEYRLYERERAADALGDGDDG